MNKTNVPFIQPGVKTEYLHSKIIGQELQLYIKLPWTYTRSEREYPLLLALDGNRSFPLYSTLSLMFETPGSAREEIIIAGIGYKLDDDRIKGLAQWAAWRTRDFTPEYSEEVEVFWKEKLSAQVGGSDLKVSTGGAPDFLEALREEIIPFLEANYRVSSTDRGLAGYSYGGLFTFYTLFHTEGLFNRYFSGSPTFWDILFDYEEKFAETHNELPARLLITTGGLESDKQSAVGQMVRSLNSRGYPGLEMNTVIFEGEGHESAYAASVSRALNTLYS